MAITAIKYRVMEGRDWGRGGMESAIISIIRPRALLWDRNTKSSIHNENHSHLYQKYYLRRSASRTAGVRIGTGAVREPHTNGYATSRAYRHPNAYTAL